MFQGVFSRLRGMTGHPRSEVAQAADTRLILPPGPPPLLLSHLSTHHLRGMAQQAATESVGEMDRPSLLALVDSMVRAKNGLKWEVQIGKVTRLCFEFFGITKAPQAARVRLTLMQGSSLGRVNGQLISFNNELYMLGGVPTKYFFSVPGVYTDNWNKMAGFLMKLDSETRRWQSEEDAELSQQAWSQKQYMTVTGRWHRSYCKCPLKLLLSIHRPRRPDMKLLLTTYFGNQARIQHPSCDQMACVKIRSLQVSVCL